MTFGIALFIRYRILLLWVIVLPDDIVEVYGGAFEAACYGRTQDFNPCNPEVLITHLPVKPYIFTGKNWPNTGVNVV